MPTIPLEFDPPSYDYEESGHLTWENDEASHWITWPLIGAKLFTPKDGMSVNLNEIKRLNTHQFSFYGSHGYSVDQFHEFFVEVLPKHISINFANVEVTIGEVTPLGVYLFYNQYDPHIDGGGWEGYSSVRIYGCPAEQAELYLLNAFIRYEERTTVIPHLMPVEMLLWKDPEEKEDIKHDVLPPCCADIEPTRFYYSGLHQDDDASSCLYFYRVLEFYAFFYNQSEASKLRHDHGLSDREFLKQIAAVISRDEKGPILKLVNQLADQGILNCAEQAKVITASDHRDLGSRLYDFRNSIVHAKYDQRSSMHSQSILSGETDAKKWQEPMRRLAWKAINTHGRKLA